VLAKVEEIVARAHELIEESEPGPALFTYLGYMVEQGATNRGLAEALSSGGFDIDAAAAASPFDLAGAELTLLTNAQATGAVRPDVTPADLKALVVGCLARERAPADPAARTRMVEIVCAGLKPASSSCRAGGIPCPARSSPRPSAPSAVRRRSPSSSTASG
jgi:hypothetical protein